MKKLTEELILYEKSIKKVHSFGWTPKYMEETNTNLNNTVFEPIAVNVCEELGWEVIYYDKNIVEAKRIGYYDNWTEKIIVTYLNKKIQIESISLKNQIWDNGQNSKRVKLFIHLFNKIEKSYNEEELKQLEIKTERANNLEDYKIPKSLPLPKTKKNSKMIIPVASTIIVAILTGFILAVVSIKGIYFIGLYEIVIGLLIGLLLRFIIEYSNFTKYDTLHFFLIGLVITVFVFNQYFQYYLHMKEYDYHIGLFKFLKLRFKSGFTINNSNTGWVGILISWIFQLGLTYYVGLIRLTGNLITYRINRIPIEVVNFVVYYHNKGKTKNQIREELSNLKWLNKQDQDEVFEAVGAIHDSIEINRME